MPEWLIERGIGESRGVRIEHGEIVECRIFLADVIKFGTICRARLGRVGPPAVAICKGQEFLLPKGAPGYAEGAALRIAVSREAIPGAEHWKRPRAVLVNNDPHQTAPFQAKEITFPAPRNLLEEFGWSDLLEEARSGIVNFEGGQLLISPTPAMTLIDIDGHLPRFELAMAGATAAVRTILRHSIGGSIGLDLPTLASKAQRHLIGGAVDAELPQPFERTAVNGFGFLQIVRRRTHASLFELAADRAPFEARALLRRAAFEPPGGRRLVAHPAVVALLERRPEWIAALAAQLGGAISLRADPALPMSGGYGERP